MIPSRFIRTHRLLRSAAATTASTSLAAVLLAGSLQAKPIPSNLGNGLEKLVESHQAITRAKSEGKPFTNAITNRDGRVYNNSNTAALASNAIFDTDDRILVRVTLDGSSKFSATRKAMKAAVSSLSITAKDKTYRGVGIMNAYVSLDEVPALAKSPGVAAVIMELRPITSKNLLQRAFDATSPAAVAGQVLNKLGTAFDQGVTQHQIDQIDKFYNPNAVQDLQGQGMQIAALSNSYNAHTSNPASIDVANGDLPGGANDPAGNTTPVFILQDDLSSTASDDEGRGMVQILHKMAPKAALGFATADGGEVNFANNIRGLAGVTGYTAAGQTFKADTECDDVGYLDEPFFQDGIIANGVDDATANGTAYFSSANNNIGSDGYESVLRWVPNGTGTTAATNSALVGTNINLANVPANLYAGGFHNFNPNGGQDVAQTVNDNDIVSAQVYGQQVLCVFQWNEPYDQTAQPNNLTQIYQTMGNYTSTATDGSGDQTYTIPNTLTAGTLYQVSETANNNSFDGVLTIYDPSGNVILGPQDTGTDETGRFLAPVTGSGYKVKIGHYSTTTGAYTLTVYSSTGFSGNTVQTQISLLAFDTQGNYLPNASLTTNALTTNQPIQLGYTSPTAGTQVQFVIARANVPAPGPNVADHCRYLFYGNGIPGYGAAEYFTYNTVTSGGHNASSTNNGVAAYSVFRPSLPETFTGCGPVTVYYDKMSNRLATPDVRLQPRFAAADAANVSSNMNGYFVADSGSDPDTNGNFSGTSAAAPHATAIAALVLQAHGGKGSLTPAQMTNLLQRSTFPHDLDPNFSSGTARVIGGTTGAGKVTITVSSDGSTGTLGISGSNAVQVLGTTNLGIDDNNAFTVAYTGGSTVTSLVFNPAGAAGTAGNVSGGSNGVVYSTDSVTPGGTATYFENNLPGAIFRPATKPFTPGNSTTGTTAAAAFTNLSDTSGTRFYTMTLTPTNLTGGSLLRFGVGRGLARSAAVTATGAPSTAGAGYYNADIFGGGTILPSGAVVQNGMRFSGTTADGGTFTGVIQNRIGSGWSKQDGYGFINAVTAVGQTVQ